MLCGDIVILKNALPKDMLHQARDAIHVLGAERTAGQEASESGRRRRPCDELPAGEVAVGEERDGWAFLPQCIHYPRGGGFFQEHVHDLKPQRIGLVLSGSVYGEDYQIGGGRFHAQDGSWVVTESRHDIGDVTLFRYDLGHDITPVDPEQPLDWSDDSGRWSMVLPLKPLPR